ncbi:MAG: hypothetical protein MZV49_12260 [Rhodopseudomonas palustris]|nr:hypothetical protein [Rhodopseudomonas palustris]
MRMSVPAVPIYKQQMTAVGDERWQVIPVLEELKPKAKAEGLWNLFLPPIAARRDSPARRRPDATSSTRCCAEMMGRVALAPRGVQLLGARHRQHGGAGRATARPSSKQRWLRAAARRRDPLGLR